MKRILFTTLALLMCLVALSGCNKLSNLHGNVSNEDATPDVANSTFHFDSYEDMIKAFGKSGIDVSSYTIKELKVVMSEAYTRFVDKVNAEKSFPQPLIDNQPITYRNKEGFSNITFFVKELYGLPWIWYFPNVSTGENFYISMTYLPDSEKHKKYCGVGNEKILKNAERLKNSGIKHVFRVPLVVGITDTEGNQRAIAEFVGESRVELLPYNRLAPAKYKNAGREFSQLVDGEREVNPMPELFENARVR